VLKLKQRKGIAMTFNWIFSIIVGAIIFSFFIYFAIQNTDLFGNITAKQVAWELDNIFSGFQTTSVETTLKFDKTINLKFRCNDENQDVLINNKGKHILRDKIIFAPEEIENNEFLLWTKEWKVPYKVGNFIFLTSPFIGYELDGIPEDLKLNNLKSGGDRIIKFSNTECRHLDFTDEDKIIYYVKDLENDEYYGRICMNNEEEYTFYGKAMIYAAIFADDFDCVYDLMMKKLGLISKLYNQKAELLNYHNSELKEILIGRDGIENPQVFKSDVDKIKQANDNRFSQNKALLY